MKKANPILALIITVALLGTTSAFAERGSSQTTTSVGIRVEDSRGRGESEPNDDKGGERTSSDDQKTKDDRGGIRGFFGIKSSSDDNAQMQTKSRERALAEIDRRIVSLNKLEARVNDMDRVSASTKASIKATVAAQITYLTDLRAKIVADTDEATLKADIASITKAYRIYMLIIPQGAVLSAADRIHTTATIMSEFGTKLETRIADAKAAGKDVSALESAYTDYKAKLADAHVQADAAVKLTADLKPDNGDQATIDANKKAMTDARAKIDAGRDDLQTARKDADTIVKGLKTFNIKVESNTKVKTDR